MRDHIDHIIAIAGIEIVGLDARALGDSTHHRWTNQTRLQRHGDSANIRGRTSSASSTRPLDNKLIRGCPLRDPEYEDTIPKVKELMTHLMLHLLQIVGILCMILGVILFIVPILLNRLPSITNVPWILLYVYRQNGFVFVTSPLLLIISMISLLWWTLTRSSN